VAIARLEPGDHAEVEGAAHLFDGPAREDATRLFLEDPTHHLLLAYDEGVPVGFVSGVELTHPDKGTEMLLYELAVDEPFRRKGIARALVERLATVARERGCYGMFVLAERSNDVALATYAALEPAETEDCVMFTWEPL